jgi:hypothetical protein
VERDISSFTVRADGRQIAESSNEYLTVAGNDRVPIPRQELRKIGGTITIGSENYPESRRSTSLGESPGRIYGLSGSGEAEH